jgi:formylglycine-generating enzyme required for sulfatase activity
MVDIPGGHIVIGLHCEEVREIAQQTQPFGVLKESIEIEAPQLRVKIAPFRMGKYCVTNQEFYSFIKQVGSQHLPTSWQEDIFDPEKANHPVFSVSFSAANEYCLWLSEKTKRNFRLPKEAEWEYVAGGTERFKFPWGNTFQQDHANTIEEQILSTTPIGMFAQGHSPFGVLDMAGNVEEYTMDRLYSYNGKLLDDKNCIKPLEGCRVIRGGSFARFHNLARTTSRHADYQSDKYVIGFRLVEEFSIH